MSSDLVFHEDIYNDLFITHGGLLSKKSTQINLNDFSSKSTHSKEWLIVKKHILNSINTHDEVTERQPILAKLFTELKMGKDIKPLNKEGDLLLRDFIVEVKQPSILNRGVVKSSSQETNDQQLLRAMRYRKKKWGILTNGSEWQFVYEADNEHSKISIPFVSFSLLDMITDEKNAEKQIGMFLSILLNREYRNYIINDSNENKWRATQSYSKTINMIVTDAKSLNCSENDINQIIKLIFKLTFIFYSEDLGALPRMSRLYRRYDIRKVIKKDSNLNFDIIKKALKAFASQKWSSIVSKNSGNQEFWNIELEKWLKENMMLLNQIELQQLWFDSENEELDISEISSGDLCDVYQNCVSYESENVGTVYTSKGLSNFINHMVLKNIRLPIKKGDIIMDPACGSGHLLKRVLFVADQLVDKSGEIQTTSELIEYICTDVLCGIDKNETAVFITKINLWLSCVRINQSLPVLKNIVCDDTLKRFTKAFDRDKNHKSEFIKSLGTRVIAIISNPPWSMIFGEHPDKWIAQSDFWKKRKSNITRQDNTALSFGYLANEVLDNDGAAIMIMPGVFFVGSTAKLRDHLMPNITAYAPYTKNTDFSSVDPSQNYGIVCFQKRPRKAKNIMLYTGIDSGNLSLSYLDETVFSLPKNRKDSLEELSKKFTTDTLLPLFGSSQDMKIFEEFITTSKPCLIWDKGSKGLPLKGPQINELTTPQQKDHCYFVGSENRGNSIKPVQIKPFSIEHFENCSHKIIRLNLETINSNSRAELVDFYNSSEFNSLVNCLKTSKSTQTAILNLLGVPTELDKPKSAKELRELKKRVEEVTKVNKKRSIS